MSQLDTAKKSRVDSLVEGVRTGSIGDLLIEGNVYDADLVNPADAMSLMLQYLQLDRDGGILNVCRDRQQHSKVSAIRKTKLEMCLALFALCRSIANPAFVTLMSGYFLWRLFTDAMWAEQYRVDCAKVHAFGPLPLEQSATIVAAVELIIIGIMLQYICILALVRCPGGDDEAYSRDVVHPKYIFMAKFFVRYLRFLQTFSALRILSYVHPELLTKNAREFLSTRDDIARTILEKFLKLAPGQASDDRLILKATSIILLKDSVEDSCNLVDEAKKRLEMKPWQAVKRLQVLDEGGHIDYATLPQVNGAALKYVWRLKVYMWIQYVLFGLIVLTCCVLGFAAFMVKLCHMAVLLLSDKPAGFEVLVALGLFFNGLVGIVSVNQLLWWRVETFVFGGSDAYLSTEERYVLDVYLAVLYKQIWESKDLHGLGKLATLVQLDEDDIQQLIVEEDEVAKAQVIWHVGNYIKKFGHAGHFMRSSLSQMLIGMDRARADWSEQL
jgi:hypothetical protein